MDDSTPIITWFANREYYGKQYSHNHIVCEHLIVKLWENLQNHGIMLKHHLFPLDYGKKVVFWPKMPNHWLSIMPPALGSFGGPRMAFFPQSLEKRWYFGP